MSVIPKSMTNSLLDRRVKYLDNYSYKLDTSSSRFGMDTPFTADPMDIDEANMAVWIPFASGERRDGVGDLLEVGGIDTSRHVKNPIVLFDHGKTVSLPVGLSEEPNTKEYMVQIDTMNRTARAKAYFYQGSSPMVSDDPFYDGKKPNYDHALFCEQLFDLIVKRYVRAGSIGYQVVKAMPMPPDYMTGTPQGLHLLQTLLLEVSAVVMPANADTVRKALDMPKVAGKPLSPVLVKSLAPYAAPRKAQMGYEQKAPNKRGMDRAKQRYEELTNQGGHTVDRIMDSAAYRGRMSSGADHSLTAVDRRVAAGQGDQPFQWTPEEQARYEEARQDTVAYVRTPGVIHGEIEPAPQYERDDTGNPVDEPLDESQPEQKSVRVGRKAQPSDNISPGKARQMLEDGMAHGHPLTEKQRRMLGAAAGRGEKAVDDDEPDLYFDAEPIDEGRLEYAAGDGLDFSVRRGSPQRARDDLAAIREGGSKVEVDPRSIDYLNALNPDDLRALVRLQRQAKETEQQFRGVPQVPEPVYELNEGEGKIRSAVRGNKPYGSEDPQKAIKAARRKYRQDGYDLGEDLKAIKAAQDWYFKSDDFDFDIDDDLDDSDDLADEVNRMVEEDDRSGEKQRRSDEMLAELQERYPAQDDTESYFEPDPRFERPEAALQDTANYRRPPMPSTRHHLDPHDTGHKAQPVNMNRALRSIYRQNTDEDFPLPENWETIDLADFNPSDTSWDDELPGADEKARKKKPKAPIEEEDWSDPTDNLTEQEKRKRRADNDRKRQEMRHVDRYSTTWINMSPEYREQELAKLTDYQRGYWNDRYARIVGQNPTTPATSDDEIEESDFLEEAADKIVPETPATPTRREMNEINSPKYEFSDRLSSPARISSNWTKDPEIPADIDEVPEDEYELVNADGNVTETVRKIGKSISAARNKYRGR